ncbi:nuclear transport factor 2 family protein [Amycolatopsis sp. NEAU-NG30]|uniref:Nuclear transport factor 2 family protein n=1 Tax=Amycolatopsis melonis TaxID=3156488 RepID=A0ABV0L836_9PSEU
METTITVAKRYLDALAAGDFDAVAALFTENVAWHQPGGNRFSGTHVGGGAVGQLLGGQMAVTGGTLEVKPTGAVMVNDALFTLPVHFTAKRDGAEITMDGVDVFRVEGDRIAEVWLFSADQTTEDAFWDAA